MKPGHPSALINTLFRISVIAIGLSLPSWLYLAELKPHLLLKESEVEYRALAAACNQAVRATEITADTEDRISPAQAALLDVSLEIGLLPCKSYAQLKEQLLSQGVSQHALAALHLSASSDPSYPDLRNSLGDAASLDAQLRVAITKFGLTPLPLKDYQRDAKFRLGEKLFNDPLLSGHRDRSCVTCHKLEFATADGRELEPRLDVSSGFLPEVPARNVPDLWNRDHNDVSAMLWDGRLQAMVVAEHSELVLPEALDTSDFENLMAVQSVRPIFTPVEMLGGPGAANQLAPNEAVARSPEKVLARVAPRLFIEETGDLGDGETYRALFRDSYGLTAAEEVRPAHLGNALAHYIEIEFQSRDTPWDQYLAGDLTALTENQKRGALLFYGIGKCAICHSGNVFSDFAFHSVGVPEVRAEKDLGRFYATREPGDRFLFRTPPLRNVTLTAPYFHNGQIETLAEAIEQHLNPHRFAREYAESGEHLMNPTEIAAISPLLATLETVTELQTQLLSDFLSSLEDCKASNCND